MQKTASQKAMESRSKHSDQVAIVVPKGERQVWNDYAASKGIKVSDLIRLAVRHAMETDFPPSPPFSN